jgi:hypothetical protein
MRAARAVLVFAVLAYAGQARAYHDELHRATDETAYTLEGGHVRLGLWKVQVGITDFAMIGTYTLPWAVLAATVHAKLRLIQKDPFALAVQAGFAYFDSKRLRWLDDSVGDAVVTAVPLEAFFSYRAGDGITFSSSAVYTEVGVDGTMRVAAFDGAGRGATDNVQLTATLELRLSRVIALMVYGRWLVVQRVVSRADATLHPDAFTTVDVHGDLAADDRFQIRDAFSIVPALHLSWGSLNMRFGLGYGNFNIPLVNFVLPQRTLIPELDLFFVL